MRTLLILLTLSLAYQLTAQSDSYELIVRSSQDKVFVGDDIEYFFYVKNNSSEDISVPTAKSAARGIDDVLTHTFEIFNDKGEQINKLFKCGVGGADRRILSGVLIKPGDSSLLVSRKFNPTEAGTYTANYLFDFHPNNGSKPNPSPNFKTMILKTSMNIEVHQLDANVVVTSNRISAEELGKAPVFNSISAALGDPNNVYRLKLNNPTMEEIAMISSFKNIQDLSLSGGYVDSLPVAMFDLSYRFLDISVGVKSGINIPEGIKNSSDLAFLTLKPIYGADLSGFVGGKFPALRFITIMSVSEPLALTLPVENMPALEGLRIVRTKSITELPSDFSACPNFKQFEVWGESVNYGNEFIMAEVTSLNLYGNSSNTIPNMSKCTKLETLSFANMQITELPAHILDIPNLKQLVIRKDTGANETLKLLKKKGVEIIKT